MSFNEETAARESFLDRNLRGRVVLVTGYDENRTQVVLNGGY